MAYNYNSHVFSILKPLAASDRYTLGLGEAFLTNPTALTVDQRDESLYIADGTLLLKLTREGRLKIAAGKPPEFTDGNYEEPTTVKRSSEKEFKAPLVSTEKAVT